MYGTGENSTERDPQIYNRSPESALKGTEDRAETCDVQQLDEEQLPLRHNNVIDAIVDRYSGCIAIIRSENVVNKLAVGEITADQYQ